jgi:hypothetical protein
MNIANINSIDFDYYQWTQTSPNKKEFLTIWQQFTEAEKTAVLLDFAQWLDNESDPDEWEGNTLPCKRQQ